MCTDPGLQQILATVVENSRTPFDETCYLTRTWGTGAYLSGLSDINPKLEYCLSHCHKHKFIIEDVTDTADQIKIHIIHGCVSTIKEMVKNEIDHFDSNVVFHVEQTD